MNVDHILAVFNDGGVPYILIGGVNFLLRPAPILTFDIDFWIEDSAENLHCAAQHPAACLRHQRELLARRVAESR